MTPTQFRKGFLYVGIKWLLPLSEHSSASCYKNCVYWVLRMLDWDERGTKKGSTKRDRMRTGIIGLENYFQTCQNQTNNIHLYFGLRLRHNKTHLRFEIRSCSMNTFIFVLYSRLNLKIEPKAYLRIKIDKPTG